ncbi:MAG: TetR/AcrR family transcriptional regulator [Myxococcales bacterium]|nr:TetR/AcrR family transcriptional regulator [Myxococcales bacterium]MCB9737080.1 TetR/AcrR family transcriptional regulator [Deltaproteobacteria bacterium]
MPRPRFDKLPPEKRRAILDAAGEELATHGFDKASLNAIIARAGVSKGAFYYYFDDKVDLFATVLEDLDATYAWSDALRAEGVTKDNFWDRMRELTERTFADARERPWLMDVGKVFYEVPAEVRESPRLRDVFAHMDAAFQSFVRRGQEVGAIRTDLPATLLIALFYAIDQAFAQWLPAHYGSMGDAERAAFEVASFDLIRRLADP